MSEDLLVVRPAFSAIDLERVETELDRLLAHCQDTVDSVVANVQTPAGAVSWDSVKQPLSDAHNQLSLFWSPLSHLNSVMSSDRLREVHKASPESAKAAASDRAKEQGGWMLDLQFPTYYAVMTFAHDRALREEMYTAFCTRASDQWTGPVTDKDGASDDVLLWDNAPLMQEILSLRAEKARLLEFESYADMSMVRKMVSSPNQVMSFLDDLAQRAVPAAREEFAELAAFASEHLGLDSLQAWDVSFASERLRQNRFSLSEEELKPYFPASKVIPGMFAIVGRLFDVSIEQISDADVYHSDVALYRITDKSGQVRGEFYMDNYAREKKRGGAWMDVCASRQRTAISRRWPV